jgi:hypothetical protein
MMRNGTRSSKKKKKKKGDGVRVKCHLPKEFKTPTTSPFHPSDILNKSQKIKPKREREVGPFESE